MADQKPKNQLSFVRETLELIDKESLSSKTVLEILQNRWNTKYNTHTSYRTSIKDYLQRYRENNNTKVALDPYSQIYFCIKIISEHIIYIQVNKMDEDGIVQDLNQIRNIFEALLREGLYKQFRSYTSNENRFSIPLENLKFHISILRKIESRYLKYEITEDQLTQYQESINELIENIENSNLRENIKYKILKNLLEIKQMLDNIYAFSRDDIEKQIIANSFLWSQFDDNNEVIKENKPKFLQFAQDFMTNIVNKMQDPNFISEILIRTALGETLKNLPPFIEKMLPPN